MCLGLNGFGLQFCTLHELLEVFSHFKGVSAYYVTLLLYSDIHPLISFVVNALLSLTQVKDSIINFDRSTYIVKLYLEAPSNALT